MFALTFFGDILVAVGAYTASIYTWPWLRSFFVSAQSDIASLEAKLAALKSAFSPTSGVTAAPPPAVKPPGT